MRGNAIRMHEGNGQWHRLEMDRLKKTSIYITRCICVMVLTTSLPWKPSRMRDTRRKVTNVLHRLLIHLCISISMSLNDRQMHYRRSQANMSR
jgi:hypothetical protein